MVRLKGRWVVGRIQLKFEEFESICPFTKQSDKGNIELSYTPGQRQIDESKLQNYLASFKNKQVPMEVVPIEVLKYCIEDCVNQIPWTREAAPEEMEVKADFPHGGKKGWGMTVSLKFNREIT